VLGYNLPVLYFLRGHISMSAEACVLWYKRAQL
jgi:hypothetical protein